MSFSDSLVELLNTDEAYSYLADGTWMEGGCVLLGMSLCPLLGEGHKLKAVGRLFDDGHVVDHIVIETDDRLLLDADGMQSSSEMSDKIRSEWGIDVMHIRDVDYDALEEYEMLPVDWHVSEFRKFLSRNLFS